jgi:hypothetical protein
MDTDKTKRVFIPQPKLLTTYAHRLSLMVESHTSIISGHKCSSVVEKSDPGAPRFFQKAISQKVAKLAKQDKRSYPRDVGLRPRYLAAIGMTKSLPENPT